MSKSIVVSELQGQKKLIQNKTQTERNRVIKQLEKSGYTVEKDLADEIPIVPILSLLIKYNVVR